VLDIIPVGATNEFVAEAILLEAVLVFAELA